MNYIIKNKALIKLQLKLISRNNFLKNEILTSVIIAIIAILFTLFYFRNSIATNIAIYIGFLFSGLLIPIRYSNIILGLDGINISFFLTKPISTKTYLKQKIFFIQLLYLIIIITYGFCFFINKSLISLIIVSIGILFIGFYLYLSILLTIIDYRLEEFQFRVTMKLSVILLVCFCIIILIVFYLLFGLTIQLHDFSNLWKIFLIAFPGLVSCLFHRQWLSLLTKIYEKRKYKIFEISEAG